MLTSHLITLLLVLCRRPDDGSDRLIQNMQPIHLIENISFVQLEI